MYPSAVYIHFEKQETEHFPLIPANKQGTCTTSYSCTADTLYIESTRLSIKIKKSSVKNEY